MMLLPSFSPYIIPLVLAQCGQLANAYAVHAGQQNILGGVATESILRVRAELKKAEIIPTVIDDFLPTFFLNVSWPSDAVAQLGNTIKPKHLQDEPTVELLDKPTAAGLRPSRSNMTYTVILTDPDAPARDTPEWSEICHWIVTGVPISGESPVASNEERTEAVSASLREVVEYKPPGPPPKTGKHRYVFLAFAPANGTSIPLDLSKPKDRKHWGYDGERQGVRQWAEENQLVPVGANFIYAQNKKQ